MCLSTQIKVNVDALQKSDTDSLENIHYQSSHVIRNHKNNEHRIDLSLNLCGDLVLWRNHNQSNKHVGDSDEYFTNDCDEGANTICDDELLAALELEGLGIDWWVAEAFTCQSDMDIWVQVHDLNESLEEVQAAVSAAKTGRNHSVSF